MSSSILNNPSCARFGGIVSTAPEVGFELSSLVAAIMLTLPQAALSSPRAWGVALHIISEKLKKGVIGMAGCPCAQATLPTEIRNAYFAERCGRKSALKGLPKKFVEQLSAHPAFIIGRMDWLRVVQELE